MKRIIRKLLGRPRLISMGPETQETVARTGERPLCACMAFHKIEPRSELNFHRDDPDPTCSAWLKLLDLIDQAEQDGREVFEPGAEFVWEEWIKLKTLPPSIGK